MKKIFCTTIVGVFVTFIFLNVSAQVNVGDMAPIFKTKDDNGKSWKLKSHIGKKNVVLYFYPAAMTGGCTKQACAYRDDKTTLDKLDAIVVGISGDEVENLRVFKDVYDLNFPLLADIDGSIANAYGVPVKDGGSIEREYGGGPITLSRAVTTARWTIVINKEGKVAYVNKEVNAAEDSKNIIEILDKI